MENGFLKAARRQVEDSLKTLKQYAKEFFLAAVLALAWTTYNFTNSGKPFSLLDAVNIFGPAFFIIAWITGNFFRIKKQSADRAHFEKITDLLTGGNSYPNITTVVSGGGSQGQSYPESLQLTVSGKHSLFDLTVTVTDLIKMVDVQLLNPTTNGSEYQTRFQLGTFGRSFQEKLNRIFDPSLDRYDFFIYSAARNGSFQQQLKLLLVNGEWCTATRITKDGVLLHEYTHPRFPLPAWPPGALFST
jgi:hypothetical protein